MRTLPFVVACLAYSLTTSSSAVASGGSDDCAQAATADAISGSGTWTVDTLNATAGFPSMPCTQPPGVVDVWFYWTATATGTARVSTCFGSSFFDSLIGVAFDGVPAGSCPTSVWSCVDDNCTSAQFREELTFPISAGQHYFIELGAFQGSGYVGDFSITQTGVPQPPANNSCATPTPIYGTGTYGFTTSHATTGAEGQSQAICSYAGSTAIQNDIWFAWTALSSGPTTLSLCSGTTLDTKVAVYAGAGCPTSAAIACNDNACSLRSRLSFFATAGQIYMVQLGSPVAAFGGGTFTIAIEPAGCQYDDGSAENALGMVGGGDILALQRFDATGPTEIGSISASAGPFFDVSLDGRPFTVAVWDDPDDDGMPDDLVLLATGTGVIQQTGQASTWMTVDLVPSVAVSGVYFLGYVVFHDDGQWPGALDGSHLSSPRAYVAGAPGGGTLDLAHLENAPYPVSTLESIGYVGYVWLVRSDCDNATGAVACLATSATCPCGNGGLFGNGCGSSVVAAGAHLSAEGAPLLLADTVVLNASGMPNGVQPGSCTFAQASSLSAGIVFGDGITCLGGSIVRLGTRPTSGGSASFGAGNPGDPSVSVAGLITGPGVRYYQVVYRNAAAFCTSATFNITNGYSILWN